MILREWRREQRASPKSLFAPRRGARQHEARNVDARDQQDNRHRSEQGEKRLGKILAQSYQPACGSRKLNPWCVSGFEHCVWTISRASGKGYADGGGGLGTLTPGSSGPSIRSIGRWPQFSSGNGTQLRVVKRKAAKNRWLGRDQAGELGPVTPTMVNGAFPINTDFPTAARSPPSTFCQKL